MVLDAIVEHQGGCELDKNYTGPKLSLVDGIYKITIEFILEMLEWFKQGKTLHRRFVLLKSEVMEY